MHLIKNQQAEDFEINRDSVCRRVMFLWSKDCSENIRPYIPCANPSSNLEKSTLFKNMVGRRFLYTPKYNGERHFLLMARFPGRACLLIKRSGKYIRFHNLDENEPLDGSFDGTLLDGELVNGVFYAFDAIAISGRKIHHLKLEQRISELGAYLEYGMLSRYSQKFVLKQWYEGNFSATLKYMNNKKKNDIDYDGWIIADSSSPLFHGIQEDSVWKWKPQGAHTIDCYVTGGPPWNVYAGEGKKVVDIIETLGFERPNDSDMRICLAEAGINEEIDHIPQEVYSSEIDTDDRLVVEFKIPSGRGDILIPIGIRRDKLYANDISIIRGTIENERENISIDRIRILLQ